MAGYSAGESSKDSRSGVLWWVRRGGPVELAVVLEVGDRGGLLLGLAAGGAGVLLEDRGSDGGRAKMGAQRDGFCSGARRGGPA